MRGGIVIGVTRAVGGVTQLHVDDGSHGDACDHRGNPCVVFTDEACRCGCGQTVAVALGDAVRWRRDVVEWFPGAQGTALPLGRLKE